MESSLLGVDAREGEPQADDAQTQRQLERFTLWFRQAALAFGVLALAAAVYWSDVWMGITAGAVLLFAAMVTAGRYWLARGKRHRAVMTVCFAVIFNASWILAAQPVLFPTLLVAVLLPVTLSLQFARPSARTRCITLASAFVFVVALVGRYHQMPSRVPDTFLAIYMLGSVTVIAGLFLVLVVQWSSRLFDRLDDLRAREQEADVARREQAREHARLEAMLASQQDCVIAADELGHVTLMNPAAEALTGWPFAEAHLRPITDVLVIETTRGGTTEDIWSRMLRGGKPFEQMAEIFVVTRGGPRRPVAASAAAIRGAGQPQAPRPRARAMAEEDASTRPTIYGGIFTLRDISAHLDGIARLRQTERFELIQSMASIVGRDYRFTQSIRGGAGDAPTPLPAAGASLAPRRVIAERRQPVVRHLAALRATPSSESALPEAESPASEPELPSESALPPESPRGSSRATSPPQALPSQEAPSTSARIVPMPVPEPTTSEENLSRLVESFLALGRPQRISPQPFDPLELIFDVAQFLPRVLGRHVSVVVRPGRDVGEAFADSDRMRDVLLQLSLAARQRMATGGTVTLGAHRTQVGEALSGMVLGPLAAGTYIRLDVRDSGCGYTRDQLLRLFEPFQFTTHREVDQSLRLAATYGAIRQNAGALQVDSRPRLGSTFSVYLPAADSQSSGAKRDRTLGPI